MNSLLPSLRIIRVRKITRGDHLSTNWVCVEDGPKHFTITHRYNTNNHSQLYHVQCVIFISFRDPNRLLLDRRKVCWRHAPRWVVTWGVVLAVIGYSPEATTPGTGLLLARDTGEPGPPAWQADVLTTAQPRLSSESSPSATLSATLSLLAGLAVTHSLWQCESDRVSDTDTDSVSVGSHETGQSLNVNDWFNESHSHESQSDTPTRPTPSSASWTVRAQSTNVNLHYVLPYLIIFTTYQYKFSAYNVD